MPVEYAASDESKLVEPLKRYAFISSNNTNVIGRLASQSIGLFDSLMQLSSASKPLSYTTCFFFTLLANLFLWEIFN
jgi:hypothetical protein